MSLLVQHPAEGVIELQINRPQRLNALTLESTRELLEAARVAMATPSVRTLLLTGAGRAFSAGKDRDEPAAVASVTVMRELAECLVLGPKPVVAAAQGWAVGGGCEILANCDFVVAGADLRLRLPEAELGLAGTNGITALLPKLVGMQRAKMMLMLGTTLDATQALEWGLVCEVVEGSPYERALALASELAALEPHVVADIKRLFNREHLADFHEALKREEAIHAERFG